ncbi:MAG: tyrosine-type recombinase/integrase [Bacillales bacterium]|jgi:integrase/recombinase XerC|nr:tyrosine-type recombinase/integrase [Bacillales bacterium]
MEEYLDLFIKYLSSEKGYSTNTVSSYLLDLKQFKNEINKDLLLVTSEDVDYFLYSLKDVSQRTQARKISSLKSFYSFLFKLKYLPTNPLFSFTNPKYKKKLPDYLFKKQLLELLTYKEGTNDFLQIRNKLIILLFIDSGLRVSELSNLKIKNIDIQENTLTILGKGDKLRYTFFTDNTKNQLLQYLEIRKTIVNKNDFVIINYKGQKISARGIQKMLKNVGSNLEIAIHPHMLRHTFATILLDEGGDLGLVQAILGHTSLSTTQIYTHISNVDLQKKYQNNHPHSKKKN